MVIIFVISCHVSCGYRYNYQDISEAELKKTIISGDEIENIVDKQIQFTVGGNDSKLYFMPSASIRNILFFVRRNRIYLMDHRSDRIKIFKFDDPLMLHQVIRLSEHYGYMYPYKNDKIILFSLPNKGVIINMKGEGAKKFEYKFYNFWNTTYFRKDVFYRYVNDNILYADRIKVVDGKVIIETVWEKTSDGSPKPDDYYTYWPTENYDRYVQSLEKETMFLYRTNEYLLCKNYTDERTDNLRSYIIIINLKERVFLRLYLPVNKKRGYYYVAASPSQSIYATDQYVYFWTFSYPTESEDYLYYLNRLPIAELFEKCKDKVQKI